MIELCQATLASDDEIWVAIDTPLGWPTEFREFLEGKAPASMAAKYSEIRPIFRRAEQWLSNDHPELLYGRQTPLSPVQDQIGRQSTKGLLFLIRMGAKLAETGVWKGQVDRVCDVVRIHPKCRRNVLAN